MASADIGFYDLEAVAHLRRIREDAWALRIRRHARRGERDPVRQRAGAITGVIADNSECADQRSRSRLSRRRCRGKVERYDR
jgi:hypothetical protein